MLSIILKGYFYLVNQNKMFILETNYMRGVYQKMKAIEVKQDIYFVGVKDWNLREFHGYDTPDGSTYNSYLICDEKITLIDGVKAYLSTEQIDRIKSKVDFSQISYVIVNHVEQDHSGSLPEIMKLAPQAVVVTNNAGKMALEAHFDTKGWNFQIIKSGDSLSIGKKTLSFLTTPMLHWPDSMMTYCEQDKILFSNDGFGQHLCCDAFFATDYPMDLVMKAAKSYYANILLPFGSQAEKALNAAEGMHLDIEMIAPSHGLIWKGKKEVETILTTYASWAKGEQKRKAVVVYDTMWGATAKLANTAVAEFQSAEIPVVSYCLGVTPISQVMTEILDATYVLIGSPTLNNQLFPRVSGFLTYLKGLSPKGKKGLAFGSYGWRPGVVKEIKQVMDDLSWQTVEPFEEKYTPNSDVLEQFAQRVKDFIHIR